MAPTTYTRLRALITTLIVTTMLHAYPAVASNNEQTSQTNYQDLAPGVLLASAQAAFAAHATDTPNPYGQSGPGDILEQAQEAFQEADQEQAQMGMGEYVWVGIGGQPG